MSLTPKIAIQQQQNTMHFVYCNSTGKSSLVLMTDCFPFYNYVYLLNRNKLLMPAMSPFISMLLTVTFISIEVSCCNRIFKHREIRSWEKFTLSKIYTRLFCIYFCIYIYCVYIAYLCKQNIFVMGKMFGMHFAS